MRLKNESKTNITDGNLAQTINPGERDVTEDVQYEEDIIEDESKDDIIEDESKRI